jgi:hypothetical protein
MLAWLIVSYPGPVTPLGIRAQVVEGEIWLDGSPTAYTELAEIIEVGWRGTRSLSAPVGPLGTPLIELAVVETSAPRVMFRPDGAVLVVSGSLSALGLLATNLRGLGAVVKPGSHSHWEYFDGHPLFDPLSVPTIAEVTPSEPS